MTGGPEAGTRANYVKPGNRNRAKVAGNPEGSGSVLLVGTPYDHLAVWAHRATRPAVVFVFSPLFGALGLFIFKYYSFIP